MEEKVVKISFFKKLWYSITKFEQYPTMATEGMKRAITYLLALSAIISICMMACAIHEMKTLVLDFANYIEENMPEFTYSNGTFSIDSQETVSLETSEMFGIENIVINTLVETDEEKEQIENENSKEGLTVFLFRDKIVLKAEIEDYETIEQKYGYEEIITTFTGEDIEQFDKNYFVQYLLSGEMTTYYSSYAISSFGYYFAQNMIIVLVYSLEIALLGWITTVVLRIKMRFKALYSMAAYSITLSTILMTIYAIINYFTKFTISNFQIAYIAIAYIYLVAAIFILKDDFIKKMQEVEKIKQEQQKVREEIKEQEQKDDSKEENQNENNEESSDDEPSGSEA